MPNPNVRRETRGRRAEAVRLLPCWRRFKRITEYLSDEFWRHQMRTWWISFLLSCRGGLLPLRNKLHTARRPVPSVLSPPLAPLFPPWLHPVSQGPSEGIITR